MAQTTEAGPGVPDLVGRRALVTGAGSGIGRACALRLAAAGAKVVVADVDARAAEAVADEAGGEPWVVDLADTGALATERLEIDVLVNNAGITVDRTLKNLTIADWNVVVQTNLNGYFYTMKAALPHFMAQKHGKVIHISSFVGKAGNFGQANYAAAKAGMVGLSKALAAEVAARGITVNCVAPGFIATAMTEALSAEQRERISGAIPMGRIGTPEEVAACVVFLASEEARYVTGHTLHVNGGMAMV